MMAWLEVVRRLTRAVWPNATPKGELLHLLITAWVCLAPSVSRDRRVMTAVNMVRVFMALSFLFGFLGLSSVTWKVSRKTARKCLTNFQFVAAFLQVVSRRRAVTNFSLSDTALSPNR